jgi:hypothetical protein
MRKNRATIFLISIFFILLVVFYLLIPNHYTIREVREKTLEMCDEDNYEDAFNFLNKELDENQNCSKGKPGREDLEKILDRIYKVKNI